MKWNKYIGLAAMAVAFTACQQDMLEGENLQNGIYTLSGKVDGGAAMSRAQIQLGNTDAGVGEIFYWNEGDKFTLYQGDNDNYTEHVFSIKDYSEEGENRSNRASFVTDNPALPGEIIAVYPSGMKMDYDQEIMKVGMDFQTELDFGQGTVEEVWKDYFKNNMVMKAKATLSDGADNTLQFEHLTSLARITYTNRSGKDQNVTDIKFGGDQTFGFSKTVWFKYDIIGGNFNNGYQINYKNLTVKDGESFDFYILFGPDDFKEGDMHIHIHTAQTDVNRSPLALPTSTIAAANNNATKFEAGKRYWFKVTEKQEGLIWSKDDSDVNVGNMGVLAAISKAYPDLVTVNADNTYTVNQEKAAEVVELALSDQGTFESLDGIENFPNLERLYCDRVGLKTLDISNNQKLKVIEIRENNLTELNFSTNPALEEINCSSQNEAVLKSLDVTGNVNLRVLRCNNNTLSSLDLTKNTKLEILQCGVNEFTELNLDNNLELESLELPCNDLTSLDMSKHQNLTYLHCTENHITELDITKNTNLETLNCGNQQPDGTVITVKMTEAQKELWDTNWSQIEYWNSRNVVVSVVESAATVTIQNTELSTALQAVLGAENVTLDDNGYAVMKQEDVDKVTSLDFGYRKYTITSLAGIENFKNLQSLICENTGLVECDLNKNKALRTVDLGYQRFSKFVLNEMENLGSVNLAFSQWNLTEVNLDNNVNLSRIDLTSCSKLTNLSIAGCNIVSSLDLRHTQIATVNIPNPTYITWLGCAETLQPDWDKLTNLRNLWMWGMSDEYLARIPDFIKENLQDLHCGQGELTSLDLSKFIKLRNLSCFQNRLTTLDTSNNPELTDIDCRENWLTTLDLSANSKLRSLRCGNQTDANGNSVTLYLKLSDKLLDSWNNEWNKDEDNTNVILDTTPPVETGSGNTGGNDFTIEGIY